MIKQISLFKENISNNETNKYTNKIESPIYEPKHTKPHILELCNDLKTKQLIAKIKQSSIPLEEKNFLINAAQRHLVFNYEKIADYYAHSNKEMQRLMEESALVIIDFNMAIELGYVKLCEDIREQYLIEYGK